MPPRQSEKEEADGQFGDKQDDEVEEVVGKVVLEKPVSRVGGPHADSSRRTFLTKSPTGVSSSYTARFPNPR